MIGGVAGERRRPRLEPVDAAAGGGVDWELADRLTARSPARLANLAGEPMAGLSTIYQTLRGIADPAVDRAMADALPTARGRSLHIMALMLLDRHHQPGLLGLILAYHRLPADVQRHMVAHAGDLFRPLREAAALKGTAGPENAMRIIRVALSTPLAYLVTEQLRHGDEALRQQAAECLLHMARRAATVPRTVGGPAVTPVIDAPAVEFLQTAIHDAVAAYGRHQCESVLQALAWLLPRPMPQSLACLDERDHPAGAVMQAQLRQADQPAARRILLLMLSVPAQAAAAAAGLRQATADRTLGEALTGFHMLALRRAGDALASGEVDVPAPDAGAIDAMAPHERRGVAAYLSALTADGPTRVARLAAMRHVDDAAVRLFALRRLIELSQEAATSSAGDDAAVAFCHDPDVTVARVALWHAIRRQHPSLLRVLASLVNSPHESIRRVAGQRLAPIGFARLWETWPRLDAPRRLAVGRALMKIDPNFHRLLGDRLSLPDRKGRVRALAMIAGLNQGALFHDALIELAQSSDSHVASAAVKALGSAAEGCEPVVQILESALEHDDGRVRANAIEALAQLRSTRHVAQLVQLVEDPESRPRANAIAAMMDLRTGDAIHALRRMLDDRRPEHRHSALWLIQTVGLLELARHVAELSLTDPDTTVRQRAGGVVRDLIELMETPMPAALDAASEAPS